jgi:long-chain acyl-CoA synthetase
MAGQATTLAARPALESIIYTSGTTGRPKGVRRMAASTEQVELTEQMRRTVFGIGPGDRVLVPAPLYHTAPHLFAMRAVRNAAFLKLPARFDAEAVLADIDHHRITHLYAVPTMFARFLGLPPATRKQFDLSSLRCVLHAGGPCPPSVKKAMLDWLGPIVHEYYGSTETGPNTFARGDEWLGRPGTVGRAVPGVHVSVHDDDGRALGAKEVGELYVLNKGYADFTYLNRPDARAELQRAEKIATGDMGYFDEDGYFFLCDRKRDLVISGAVNIYPAEIEAVLMGMPGIGDVAVFGIPDEEFGEALAAHVEPLAGHDVSPDAIRAYLAQRLASFKLPRLIEIHAHLPREESGKIKKRLLREPYWAGSGRSI